MHTSAAHSRTHAYTPENKYQSKQSKQFGVINKEYHGHASDLQNCIYNAIINTRTNKLFICVHTSAAHSRTHAYTPENKYQSKQSKQFGVINKEYHGHASDLQNCIYNAIINTRTNKLFICVHTSAAHSRTHAYTNENKYQSKQSKQLGVINKEYHGHASDLQNCIYNAIIMHL